MAEEQHEADFVVDKVNKKIEVVEMYVKDLKTDFGNPRKIKKPAKEKLADSLETFGDFGLILIDEHNNIIAGNQRCSVLKEKNPDAKVLCKRLINYTNAELRAINIKDNTHAGEWDVEALADWTADLTVDLGLDKDVAEQDASERTIPEMELIHYEKYNYVMLVCRSEMDYDELIQKLELDGCVVRVCKQRKIKARAVWYDKVRNKLWGDKK